MPFIGALVKIDDVIDALKLADDEVPGCLDQRRGQSIEIDRAEAEQWEIDALSTEPEVIREEVEIPVEAQPFREALRYALAGDLRMAAIMFDRALQGHGDAQRAVEEEFRWANAQRARATRRAA